MGLYLNPGNKCFSIRLNNQYYVDKTGLLEETNKVISTWDCYICVTRPRRSGKSTAADMLEAYYGKGCDSKEMFKDFEIARCSDFEEHLNRYNVIRLDITNFIDRAEDVPGMISVIEREVIHELKEAFPDVHENSERLDDWLEEILHKTGEQFVFVIDEWDCVMRERSEDEEGQIKYLRFLSLLLKDRSYVALCYMTGILPILKTMDGSMMDMFDQRSMTRPGRFAKYTGFTEDEVKALCERYNRSYEDIESYYKGYNVNGLAVYNPVDIHESMYDNEIKPYWAKTEDYTVLRQYFKIDGVKEAVEKMLAGEKVKVDTGCFDNSMTKLKDCDDVLALLVHLGYLTYEYVDYREWVWIPNREIRKQFETNLEMAG